MALLTRRMPRRVMLMLALAVFAAGHVVVALGSSFPLLLGARFVTAWATGAFWSVSFVVAGRAAGPAARARAAGVVVAGGMLANVVGVPLGALAGQISGWRGPFWALAVLAAVAVALIARSVPADGAHDRSVPIRAQLASLRNGRLWLVLAACAATTGGVLSAYTYISPLLTDRAGIATALVPLVLVGFGVGTLIGTVLGGRLGDRHPHAIMTAVPAATAVALAAVALLSAHAVPVIALVVLLGLVGLSANPVLTSSALRSAAAAPTLGSALSVAAFNAGTAVGSWVAGLTLGSGLGAVGPVVVGCGFAALALVPAIALARVGRRHSAVDVGAPTRDAVSSSGLAA